MNGARKLVSSTASISVKGHLRGALGVGNAGVVHEYVDHAELRLDGGDDGGQLVGVGHVQLERLGDAAGGADLLRQRSRRRGGGR